MLLLILFLLSAVCSDLKTGRIPNRLIVAAFVIGVVHTAVWYYDSVLQMLFLTGKQFGSMLLMLIILIPFWKVKAFGGGDVKMACVSVWYIGFAATARSLLYAGVITTLIAGSLVASEYMANTGVLPKRLGDRLPKLKKRKGKHIVCFSVPYLAGVLIEYVIHSGYLK